MSNEKHIEQILIVDDLPENLNLLKEILTKEGNRVRMFTSGPEALESAMEEAPDIILADVNMPGMDGFELCTQIKAIDQLKEVPVIFISGVTDVKEKIRAFKSGGVDYITKPFSVQEIQARVKTHLTISHYREQLKQYNQELENIVAKKAEEVYESQIATIFALAKLAENRDNDTGRHLERVQSYAQLLTGEMRKNAKFSNQINDHYEANIYHATPLHDIGKVAIPDNILLKPGKLSPEEFEVIKTHTVIGAETLKSVQSQYPNNSFINLGMEITYTHHENWDGSGYPRGISGNQIPLSGRIMAVADVYDALRMERVYKPSFSHEKSLGILISGAGTQFDPDIIEIFRANNQKFESLSMDFNESD